MSAITQTGTVVSLFVDKGFGFIRIPGADAQAKDTFFHVKHIDPALAFDSALLERRVSFEIVHEERGPVAVNVRAAD